MCKEQKVLNYYVLCNKLKNVIRTGWKVWNVKRERLESVAEHIFGVQMLAIAMRSEYQYDIDIQKVSLMLAIHELGETVIGDLTQFQISREEKERIEHEAVHKILSGLIDGEQIERIFLENRPAFLSKILRQLEHLKNNTSFQIAQFVQNLHLK